MSFFAVKMPLLEFAKLMPILFTLLFGRKLILCFFPYLNVSANSGKFMKGPRVRNSPGECGLSKICLVISALLNLEHQFWPQFTQNSCLGVRSIPGRVWSFSPCSCSHSSR